MSQHVNPRGQKRKPEDGQGPSGHPDKRLREANSLSHDPNGELYWVVQWYAGWRQLRQWSHIHRCLPGGRPNTKNTKRGMETAF